MLIPEMDLLLILKWAVTAIVSVWSINWLIQHVIIDVKRDVHPAALKQQANISPVRKKNETAVYRNLSVPLGLPLTTGLNLRCGYQFRRGCFGDIWSMALTICRGENCISFLDGEKWSLNKINFLAKKLTHHFLESEVKTVGIVPSVATSAGFVIAIAGFMGSLQAYVPQFLPSVPRYDMGLDVLVVGDWAILDSMNGSETWYKLIVVCERPKESKTNTPANAVSIYQLLKSNYFIDASFEYSPSEPFEDDTKQLLNFTSPLQETTSFTQTCLVSTVASFTRSFPVNYQLRSKDKLTIVTTDMESSLSLQVWGKLFAVLLHGGSVCFTNVSDITRIDPDTTLLFVAGNAESINEMVTAYLRTPNRLALSWALTLLSEGVFSTAARISPNFANLRCVYIMNEVKHLMSLSSFSEEIPKVHDISVSRLTSNQLNQLRALFGSRVVMELYAPYTIMGPLAYSNIYDYRVFPSKVDTTFTCYGTLSTSVEGKLVYTEANPDLDPGKRQGMLMIRGFTIGRPVDKERVDKALKAAEKFNSSDGWMPLIGVYGVWGRDGCFYEYR